MTFTTRPELTESFDDLLSWLEAEGLLNKRMRYNQDNEEKNPGSPFEIPEVIAKGQHRQAIRRKTKAEKEAIKQRQPNLEEVSSDKLWEAQKDPQSAVLELRWESIPADALAFYRPFHSSLNGEWGIYLLADEILDYHDYIFNHSRNHLLWEYDTLLHLMIFEIFNHEFFHHLVESTATYLEITRASFGRPRPIYLDYKYRQHIKGIDHPHHPLEEALANAYAYNALSFISRTKAGFKTATIKSYQEVIKRNWGYEPNGYCEARHYINGKHVLGGAALLEQILGIEGQANRTPLATLSKHLMPSGYSALFAKPDIPTYLTGSPSAIKMVENIVPALNETYTQLFWPKDTKSIDHHIQQKMHDEHLNKKQLEEHLKKMRL